MEKLENILKFLQNVNNTREWISTIYYIIQENINLHKSQQIIEIKFIIQT